MNILLILFFIFLIVLLLSIFIILSVSYISYKLIKFNYISSNNYYNDYIFKSKITLEKYKNHKIIGIYIIKSPINFITIILMLIGVLSKNPIKDYNILNNIYHTSIIFHIKYNNYDKHILLEKNNSINISDVYTIKRQTKMIYIPLIKHYKIKNILKKTKKRMGTINYFNWNNLFKNNCQTFTYEILKSLNLHSKYSYFIKEKINVKCSSYTNHLFKECCYYYTIFNNIIKN